MDVFGTKIIGEPVSVDLSSNKLGSISVTLHGRVLYIQSLNLSTNQLVSVPRLAGLPLRYLNLDGNPITKIREGDFAHLKDIVYLSISGLQELQEIEAYSFKGLQSLQVLDLLNNPKLKTLTPAVFSGLDSLQELNLSGSGVASLPNNMLSHLPSIKSITLGRNTHCWKTQKQGQFHRQLGNVQNNDVLNCNMEGVVLWDWTILMPEMCLISFDMQNMFLCYCHSVTSVSRLDFGACLKSLMQPSWTFGRTFINTSDRMGPSWELITFTLNFILDFWPLRINVNVMHHWFSKLVVLSTVPTQTLKQTLVLSVPLDLHCSPKMIRNSQTHVWWCISNHFWTAAKFSNTDKQTNSG